MRRLLTFLLIMIMVVSVFTLSACKSGNETTEPNDDATVDADDTTADADDTTADAEDGAETASYPYIAESGQIMTGLTEDTLEGVKIGYCVLDSTDSSIALYANAAVEYFEELGAEVTVADAQYDQATQIEQMENFVAQGASMIVVWPMSADSVLAKSEEIHNQGVQVFWQGVTLPDDVMVDGSRDTDNELMGDAIADCAIKWLDEQYPDAEEGSIHVSVFTFDLVDPTYARGQAMINAISADPRCEVTFTKDTVMSAEAGATAAEEALASDPEIKLFLCFEASAGIGVDTVLSSQFGDVSGYGIFGGGYSEAIVEVIDETAADPAASCLRGCIQSGAEDVGYDSFKNYLDCLTNNCEFPYVVMTALQPWTAFDYTLPEGWETGARPE